MAPVPVVAARRVTLAGPAEIVAAVSPEMLRLALLGKVVTAGDDVSLLPQDVLPDAVGPQPGRGRPAQPGQQGRVTPGPAPCSPWSRSSRAGRRRLVTMDTVVGWQHGRDHPRRARRRSAPRPAGRGPRAAAGPDVADAPDVDDLPGLRAQAEELTELLDLGFHHREVLGRLGTTVSLGVLVTGPAGSGKSALVRAVAAAVGARVQPLWAPELAALSQRRRGRPAARRVAGGPAPARPAVLLVTDVEALAPRDEPGPLATVFRQVLARARRAPASPVVCTTSRPGVGRPRHCARPDLLSLRDRGAAAGPGAAPRAARAC